MVIEEEESDSLRFGELRGRRPWRRWSCWRGSCSSCRGAGDVYEGGCGNPSSLFEGIGLDWILGGELLFEEVMREETVNAGF